MFTDSWDHSHFFVHGEETCETLEETQMTVGVTVGFAFFFERIVVYGQNSQALLDLFRSKRMRNKAGKYLGTVKGVILVDPSHVLYEYHTHTKPFLERRRKKRFFRKIGLKREEMKFLKPLEAFLK